MLLYVLLVHSGIENPTSHVEHKDGRHFIIDNGLAEEVFVEDDLGPVDKETDIRRRDNLLIVCTLLQPLLFCHIRLASQLFLSELLHPLVSGFLDFFEEFEAMDDVFEDLGVVDVRRQHCALLLHIRGDTSHQLQDFLDEEEVGVDDDLAIDVENYVCVILLYFSSSVVAAS